MADITKNELSRALKRQLAAKALDNITIKDITDDCGLNRQTFYYHFHDIYNRWQGLPQTVSAATSDLC